MANMTFFSNRKPCYQASTNVLNSDDSEGYEFFNCTE